MKVKILGTEYKIKHVKADESKTADADGYHEPYSKEIVLVDIPKCPEMVANIEEYDKKTLRHEIVHAFLHESGLAANSDWARNEEIVDWIALQFPKLLDAFKETECI